MKHVVLFYILSSCFFIPSLNAQQKEQLHIKIEPTFDKKKLQIQHFYPLKNGDSIQIETLKFYISNIELLNDNKSVFTLNNSYHLIDISESKSLDLLIPIEQKLTFKQIKFNLGIDSITNESGAMGGDLDPTKGMYWAWQSGYINFKIEGTVKTENKQIPFEYHLGGYLAPFNSIQTILVNVKQESEIHINLNLAHLLNEIDVKTKDKILSPSKDAVRMLEKAVAIFIAP